jgi:hypothetical protein
MWAIIAAIIFFLHGVHVLDDSADVTWLLIGLGFLSLHFGLNWTVPWGPPWRRP